MSLVEGDGLSDGGHWGNTVRFARTFSASYPALAASVPMARRALCSLAILAGATADQAESVRLAASEALTSVVLGADPRGHGDVDVSAWATPEDLWLLIGGRRPQLEGDGLGLALIAQLCDDFLVTERAFGATELRIRFRLG